MHHFSSSLLSNLPSLIHPFRISNRMDDPPSVVRCCILSELGPILMSVQRRSFASSSFRPFSSITNHESSIHTRLYKFPLSILYLPGLKFYYPSLVFEVSTKDLVEASPWKNPLRKLFLYAMEHI